MPGRSVEGNGFGDLLRSLRRRAGLTQEELAERAGLTPNAISSLERGVRVRPYPHTVRLLAGALELQDDERHELVSAVPGKDRGPLRRGAEAGSEVVGEGEGLGLVEPPTPLFGRDDDLARLVQVVRSRTARLVTLTGPGGVGKTRLALAAAHVLEGDHPDGVVPVSLASVADSEDVLGAIGRALDAPVAERPTGASSLAQHIGDRRLLLVLDNFEHLLSAAVDVGRVVASCDNLAVLATSRSPLRVRGEHEYVVGPLAQPDPEVRSVDDLVASASGAFLLHRARQMSQIALTDDDVPALAELCRRLAGLPLAIELATAQLRLLPPAMLLDRMDDVVASSPRDLPDRQRSMRATLDWSYRLLTPEQQSLFRLLSVFRGGATLDIVEDVAQISAGASSVLDPLTGLAEQSLVSIRTDPAGQPRHTMLQPVAHYARSLLVGDEATRAVRAHTTVFLDLAERAADGYEGPDQLRWLDRVEADEANLLVAIDRALELGDGTSAGRIAWAMWLYWWLRGSPTAGLRRALRCLDLELPPPVRARVHLVAAIMSYATSQLPASAEHWETGFLLAMEVEDLQIAGAARAGTGLAALGLGDLDAAEQRFREALPLTERSGDMWMTSLIHTWLGSVQLARHDAAGASLQVARGLELARARGDRLAIYVSLYQLAQAARDLERHEEARSHLHEGILLSEENRDDANLAYFLQALATVECDEHADERAPVLLGAASALREATENKSYGYFRPDESLRHDIEERARRTLGERSYAQSFARGTKLGVRGMVDFALRRHESS